ncbi:MAG: imidazolonepropionase [Steroidobacteraceae bacterium]|nr:imidazolonepropionase [Steroidobacteraceae bacterium]
MRCDRIWRNARLATMAGSPADDGLGLVDDGLIACGKGRILYAGAANAAPRDLEAPESVDCMGRLITPGLIDCHTHLVYAGNRAHEFEQRLKGVSYEAIARQGGGIMSTVKETRLATDEQLLAASLPRLNALMNEGVTTVEIKSGYGLTLEHERKQLRVARELASPNVRGMNITTTLLAAHALPPEFAGRADDYVDEICRHILPALIKEGLVDAVDAFCENIGFSREQCKRVFNAATAQGVRVKLHAEQLSDQEGAALAAAFRALSADHLEYASEPGIEAMAREGVAAVLLPGAFYFLREKQLPPIDLLRQHGVAMALATDHNPGTSPLTSILLVLNMAATLFRMTVDECLLGVTRHAAKALGMSESIGTLEAGKQCDLAIWNVERPAELVYAIGANPLHERVWRGA